MIARNAKCPCGSGKQYKRCCIDKPTVNWSNTSTKPNVNTNNKNRLTDSPICNNYPSAELLKLLSLLQLQPQNHGKNIRLEKLITEVVNSIHEEYKEMNLSNWRRDLLKECPKNHNEDPPENFFTENIVFTNGNNIVYPGIFIDIIEIFQDTITSIIENKKLPVSFVREIQNAIQLLLHIQHQIGNKLGHTYRLFEESETDELYIPPDEILLTNKEFFTFHFTDIKKICDDLGIPYTTLDSFVFKWQQTSIETVNFDDNPLFTQPFVFVNGCFILTMPTAILYCLTNYIITNAKKFDCTIQLVKGFAKITSHEILPTLGRMHWKPTALKFPEMQNPPDYMLINESMWQVDEGRYTYVTILTENTLDPTEKMKKQDPFSKYYQKRVEKVTEQLKQEKHVTEIMLLAIVQKIGLVSNTMLGLEKLTNVNYFLSLTPVELNVLTNAWELDKLSLWKYAKYLELAQKTIRFAPLTSQLAMFDFFKTNHESFFDSDKEPYNFMLLDFTIAGDVRRKGLTKLDKFGIAYGNGKASGYLQCVRKEEYYPVYISQEIYFGIIRSCLLKYKCPIWLETKKTGDTKADLYVNAILYWLNEIYEDAKDFINQLGYEPIRLELGLDNKYYELETIESLEVYDDIDSSIQYSIDKDRRQIFFTIPVEMVQFFSAPDNKGERILINFLLDILGKLIIALGGIDTDKLIKAEILDKYISPGPKKMLLMTSGDHDIKIANIDIPPKRYIQDADVSYILENQLSWLNLSQTLPVKLLSSEEKIKLLNNLVGTHYGMVTAKLKDYDTESLLLFLAKRHESLIQSRAFRHLNYPAKIACYSQFYDVHAEFSASEKDLVEASLALRILIEFVAVQMPIGKAIPADDEVDIMLAHVIEIINYASISDSIKFGIEDPEIGKLPSGRIGISNEFERKGMHEFREKMYAEEIHSYGEDFHKFFKRKNRQRKASASQQHYTDKLNMVFTEEWGITLSEIDMVCHGLCTKLIFEGNSAGIMPEEEFFSWMLSHTDLTRERLQAYLNKMKFLSRPEPLKPPQGYEAWEVYPWRFNRRLSYLLRPIISFTKNEKEYLFLSARHLVVASENLLSLFFNGELKVQIENKKIIQLLAERNKIKGGEYRDEVFEWMKANTSLEIYPYEIKIKPKGFFTSGTDKGDIDILAIDRSKNIIYSIECKNTTQSKLTYDFKMEIDNYLGINGKEGLIEKHVKRHQWLQENIKQVQEKLSFSGKPEIKSLVISKNILPLKYIKSVPIPITSFYELKSKQFLF